MVIFYNFTKKYSITVWELGTLILKFHTFGDLYLNKMKAFKILIMILAIGVALYEQVSEEKNIYVMIIAIVVFMYGMMQLSAKTPSKNQDKDEQDAE
ncbi:hypothetical protein BD847_0449 [Flavobacterium cutihirudinis]|uniref:Uncharacterized protein n=2 Tax=Flavobacterium cutihirudinis TaxID=1265740 RepID=A0A3D9FZZ9_9FLAO|nr:hypothetical protein BD847_0449 [Flavobacterium cutihirudinis]